MSDYGTPYLTHSHSLSLYLTHMWGHTYTHTRMHAQAHTQTHTNMHNEDTKISNTTLRLHRSKNQKKQCHIIAGISYTRTWNTRDEQDMLSKLRNMNCAVTIEYVNTVLPQERLLIFCYLTTKRNMNIMLPQEWNTNYIVYR